MKSLVKFISFLVLALALSAPAFAQSATAPTTASAFVGLFSNGELWASVIALVSGVLAIWKNHQLNATAAQLSTSQKIVKSVVLGVETAMALPEAQVIEAKLKAVIQAKATEYGVQPILHVIVQTLTEPAATAAPVAAS
jgi:hypothetical protein